MNDDYYEYYNLNVDEPSGGTSRSMQQKLAEAESAYYQWETRQIQYCKPITTVLWRKFGHGRLYWRKSNKHWRNWDKGDVAMCIDGSSRVYFTSIKAIWEYMGIEPVD